MRNATAFEIEFATILLGYVLDIDELSKGWEDLMMGENEDFGSRDGVKPLLYPAPYCREEGRRTEDLWRERLVISQRTITFGRVMGVKLGQSERKEVCLTKIRSSVSG